MILGEGSREYREKINDIGEKSRADIGRRLDDIVRKE